MPLTLVVEDGTGLANANAFASRSVVDTILAGTRWATAWIGETDDDRDVLIGEATAWLSRLAWDGCAKTSTQALAFPRTGLVTRDGYAVPSDSIPAWLQRATALLANYLRQQDVTLFDDNGLEPRTELEVGPVRLTPSSGGASMPNDIAQQLRPYFAARDTVELG